jgi:hypothetical protein
VKPARLVTLPSADSAFRDAALAAVARVPADLSPEEAMGCFEAELRREHPTAVVRAQHPLARPYPEAEPVWYVVRRDYASRISKHVLVPLAPAEAFAIYADRVVDWQSAVELRPVRITGRLVGDEYEAAYRLLGRKIHGRFRVVDADPPRSITMEAAGSGIRVWFMTSFRRAEEGTRVDVEGDYSLPEGLLTRIADRLVVERTIDRDIERAHRTFVALCEAAAAGSAG